jgi:hypothetical protein
MIYKFKEKSFSKKLMFYCVFILYIFHDNPYNWTYYKNSLIISLPIDKVSCKNTITHNCTLNNTFKRCYNCCFSAQQTLFTHNLITITSQYHYPLTTMAHLIWNTCIHVNSKTSFKKNCNKLVTSLKFNKKINQHIKLLSIIWFIIWIFNLILLNIIIKNIKKSQIKKKPY